jgi:hypothetical protein
MALWTQTLGITSEVIFRTADSNIASVGSTTGLLKGNTPGQTVEHAEVTIIESKSCPDGSVTMCRYKLLAIPADVTVQTNATTYIAVGPYFLTFKTVWALYDPQRDILAMAFNQLPDQTTYPFASTGIENTSTVSVGSAVRCGPSPCEIGVAVNQDVSYSSGYDWPGEENPQFDLIFTRLELRAGGLLSGTISGTAMRLEIDENLSPLRGAFKDIPVIVGSIWPAGRRGEQHPVQ